MSPQDACEVCGRTFLVGEKVHSYVSVEGRHEVCELCVDRVAAVGWLPADQDGAEETVRAGAERKPGFLGRFFSRSYEAEAAEEPSAAAPRRPETHELETERYDVEAEWRDAEEVEAKPDDAGPSRKRRRLSGFFGGAPSGAPADLPAPEDVPEPDHSPAPAAPAPDADASPAPLPDPAGRGMRPRRLQPDLSPASRFEGAIARFNSSDAGRTAAGLTRTLGAPSVSVGDLSGAEDVVRVTVAWELTWYQWGVDLGDELRPVFELEKGYEVSEIDAAARQWNASANDGRIVMVAPPRREAANGRPVHR
ncbi:MAG TPA: hypothetical protein VGH14_00835 [Solirubrobacterales bacterium]